MKKICWIDFDPLSIYGDGPLIIRKINLM